MPEPHYLVVARILRPHGVRGEVRAQIVTSHPELLVTHRSFYLSSPKSPEVGRECPVEQVRLHAGAALLKLVGCDDRDAAEARRGMLVQIPMEHAVPLEDDEYYLHQIIGLKVETADGLQLGKVVEVLETGADDVYIVRGTRGEVLLPAVSEVVRRIDLAEGKMTVELLPGLLPENMQ
jgi:16S rRNA processing protein RimM